jgi:tetratricopeptide (TPR) repeat protein/predicted Ser/Thr protein kinase
MGSVYLARDLALERDVAIKFISAEKAADASAQQRLIREAKAAAALDHPNICAVHEVIVEPDGRAAIVMQYCEGETLAETLRRGPLDVRLAISIVTDVARALAVAHKRGIIHRDIKPQNIIITPDKQAKLLDFGVARHHQIMTDSQEAETTADVTAPGIIIGTPAYMSPEQAQQLPLDGRSDLFSLGAVLYECLTGKRPFTGRSSLDVLGSVVHQQPADPSTVCQGLTEQHDEVVCRLLAKHPDDRFKSADELLGALRVLSPDTSRTTRRDSIVMGSRSRKHGIFGRREYAFAGLAVLIVIAAAGIWRWRLPAEAPNPQSAEWYRRGTDAIRSGSPHSARLALNEAIGAAPEWAPPYIRLAEAETELDDVESAQQTLLKVSSLVPTESRLSFDERMRLTAVRALMLRDPDAALSAYRRLADSRPNDPGVWLDLGRARDSFAMSVDARTSYDQAVKVDAQYAPGHLRRGTILAFEGQRDQALAAFAEAERLYRASANVEGEVETLIQRGRFLNGAGELRTARRELERAKDLADKLASRAQHIRAQLTLSTVTASEGKWQEAAEMAAAAVDLALREHLETVAADGLVDLATVLFLQRKMSEADAQLVRAIELGEKRRAQRVVARATLQRAAIMADNDRPAEALATADGPLRYFQANRYRRYEVTALSVMARAHEALGQYAEARALAEQALRTSTEIKDEAQIGEALENLAGQSNAMGALPEALDYRARGEEIHRRQNDLARLPYDLTNRADLLIRVGRHGEAALLLDEIDVGAAKRLDAYMARGRRVKVLRAVSAAIQHRFNGVRAMRDLLPASADQQPDANTQLAAAVVRYTDALSRGPRIAPPADSQPSGALSSAFGRELRYWDLAGRLARNDARGALNGAEETLAGKEATVSYEFEWRIAAIGAAAARAVKDTERERVFKERASRALERLRKEWKSDVTSYEGRPDLVELRRKAGLN